MLANVKILSKFNNYTIAFQLIGRLIGLNCLISFVSLMIQLPGLIGDHGLFPVSTVYKDIGIIGGNICLCPSLIWLAPNLTTALFLCFTGSILAFLTVLGYLKGFVFLLLYILYLSITKACGPFTQFQWDILLLESLFLCVFLYPFLPGLKNDSTNKFNMQQPNPFIWVCFLVLIFKLMLSSGLCKITANDPTWTNLTALYYHFATQPLPNPLAYVFNQLPHIVLKCGVIFVFIVELILPIFIFTNSKLRSFTAFGFIALQVIIALTGNYAFFNLLTISLCLPLMNDSVLQKIIPEKLLTFLNITIRNNNTKIDNIASEPIFKIRLAQTFKLSVAIILTLLSLVKILSLSGFIYQIPLIETIDESISPFCIANSYGLFAVMTKARPEITIEGSYDGINFKEYTFKFKPGPLNRMLPIIAPYQPRLDWQLWFIALDENNISPILKNLVYGLMLNYKPILNLIDYNPFLDKPPNIIKVSIYDYHMTNYKEFFKTGNYWYRDNKRDYFVVSQKKFK